MKVILRFVAVFHRTYTSGYEVFQDVLTVFTYVYRVFCGFHGEDTSLPIFRRTNKILSKEEVVKLLLLPPIPSRTCTIVPRCVSNNVVFLLDTSSLESQEDWRCDDMGAWLNNGVQKHVFYHAYGKIKESNREENNGNGTPYTLVRCYFKNKTSGDLKKYVSYLLGKFLLFYFFVIQFGRGAILKMKRSFHLLLITNTGCWKKCSLNNKHAIKINYLIYFLL